MKTTIAIVGVLLFAGSCDVTLAQTSSPPQFCRVLVAADTSGSVDDREFDEVIALLAEQLPDLVISVGAREIGLLPWAQPADVLRSAHWVDLPVPSVVEPTALHFTEGESIFRGARQEREQHERQLAGARCVQAELQHHRDVEVDLQPLVTRLHGLRQGKSKCSDVYGILTRCSRERAETLVLLITDGRETCSRMHRGLIAGGSAATVLILVPPEASDADAAPAINWLTTTAPWVHVVPSFRFTRNPADWLPPITGEAGPAALRIAGTR